MIRSIWIVLGVVALVTASCIAAFAADEVVTETPLQLHYVYRGQNIGLHLDGSRLTVLFDKPSTPAQRSVALEQVGLGVASKTIIDFRGSEMITLETPIRDLATMNAQVQALLASPDVEFVSPVFDSVLDDGWMTVTGKVMVRVREPHRPAAEALLQTLAPGTGIVARDFANLPGVYLLRSGSRDGFDVLAQANRLARDPRIEWAEPDMRLSVHPELIPDDPLFGDTWNLRNTGQLGGVSGIDVNASSAWDITTGNADVKVLVLDTGIQLDHPDLIGRIVGGDDFTSDIGDGGPVNACDNHGTPIAGTVAATVNNGIGTAGVAPGVSILSARIIRSPTDASCSESSTILASGLVNALAWGEAQGARISNSSFSLTNQFSSIDLAYLSTYNNGMVHFGSAGNNGIGTVSYPKSLDWVNAVSNLQRDGSLNSSSNYGSLLSFSAPGTSIWTADRTGTDGYNNTDTVILTGSSLAGPHGAGVAALLLSVEPSLTPPEVEAKLQCSARDLGPAGFDGTYGWGLLDAHAALMAPLGVDSDSDGVDDSCDNCPGDPNADQADLDADGIGDICDACPQDFHDDLDEDGVCGDLDNCPETANADQLDTDGNGAGDACQCSAAIHSFPGDGWMGWRVRGAGDVNGDGYGDVITGARTNDDAGTNAGKAHVYSGRDASLLIYMLGEAATDYFGAAVAGIGDVNGDGFDDVIVGAYFNDLGGGASNAGRAYIFFGRANLGVPVEILAGNADVILDGQVAGDNFGWEVAPMRDVDGDGVPDFLVGALGSSGATTGAAYVYSGADRSIVHSFAGGATNDRFGYSLGDAGFVDADLVPDVIVGALSNDAAGASAGRAYIYSGANGDLIRTIDGEAVGDQMGGWVANAGDVNQDGRDDAFVGAPGHDTGGVDAGRAYVISGLDGTTLHTFTGAEPYARLGWSVSATADLDRDGVGDLAVGAPTRGVPARFLAGRVHLYSGLTGAWLSSINGDVHADWFGRAIDGTKDIDGDGVADLLIGAYLSDVGEADGGLVQVYSPADADADGLRGTCDNCLGAANPGQADADSDSVGDQCDNCREDPNLGQENLDGDGLGDICDPCPADALDDIEGDGWCADEDNCSSHHNPAQLDDDGDSIGNVCDHCPADDDGFDADSDGAADGCDCQPLDPNDLPPGEVPQLQADRGVSGAATLSWTAVAGADVYSVTRGMLSALAPGSYGDCLASGFLQLDHEDGDLPPSGDGYFYLVQGESFECGLGLLGSGSSELSRENTDLLACTGSSPFTDSYPSAELAVLGTVSGSLADVGASDDAAQSITEEMSSGGNPETRFSHLEHRWDLTVPAGSRIELHLEGYRSSSADGDDFVFEYWNGGAWVGIGLPSLLLDDDGDSDVVIELPVSVVGALTIRVIDTLRDPGTQSLDTVSIDELFVRSVP